MKIIESKYEISNSRADHCPETSVPEYAFIGRSNVGKSSLINMLTSNKSLAKTSQKPGKTILINHFKINNGQLYVVDLPGYGFAARSKQQRDSFRAMIEHYVLQRRQLACLFVLIDIRHQPQKVDLEFLDFCGQHGVPIAIVFTKADKASRTQGDHNITLFKSELQKKWEELPPMFVTSSEKKLGRDEILAFIGATNKIWYAYNCPTSLSSSSDEK